MSPLAANGSRLNVRTLLLRKLIRLPLCGSDRVDVGDVHGVDLLQGTILRLNDEEVCDEEKGRGTATEDEAVEVVDLVGDEGGEEGDEEIEQPVGGCRKSDAGRAVTDRKSVV